MVKLGEHNRIHLMWVHMGFDENEMADQLARQFSALSLIGPEPALGITGKFATGVIRGCVNRKHEEYWHSIYLQEAAKGFLERPAKKKRWRFTQPEYKPGQDTVV